MSDRKKTSAKPTVYNRASQQYIQELELRRRQREEEKKRQAAEGESVTESPDTSAARRFRLLNPAENSRRREQENAQKMRILFAILGVLVVLLIAAFIYEVALGHGIKETGGERMTRAEQNVQAGIIADAQEEPQIGKTAGISRFFSGIDENAGIFSGRGADTLSI